MSPESNIGICVYTIPPILASLLFMWWLFRIWYRTRKAVYVWLLAGLGLFPACFAGVMAFNWLYSGKPTSLFNFLLIATMCMLMCLEIGSVIMALGDMEEGAVGFRDVFRKRVEPGDEGHEASCVKDGGE